jgi:hypothetical protein
MRPGPKTLQHKAKTPPRRGANGRLGGVVTLARVTPFAAALTDVLHSEGPMRSAKIVRDRFLVGCSGVLLAGVVSYGADAPVALAVRPTVLFAGKDVRATGEDAARSPQPRAADHRRGRRLLCQLRRAARWRRRAGDAPVHLEGAAERHVSRRGES